LPRVYPTSLTVRIRKNLAQAEFGPIVYSQVIRSTTVISHIEKDVLAGNLVPGERLPSEEQLCERFQASRTVIREAIQQLKGRGILRTTKGSGSYIAEPCLTTLGSAVAAYSALALEADFLELMDFRILIETECARLAARNARPPILRDLEETLSEMTEACGDKDAFGELDIKFHLVIARASQNRMYAALLAALEARCIAYAQGNRGNDAWYTQVLRTHQEILHAISDGAPDRAAAAMQSHLISSRDHFVKLEPEAEEEPAQQS